MKKIHKQNPKRSLRLRIKTKRKVPRPAGKTIRTREHSLAHPFINGQGTSHKKVPLEICGTSILTQGPITVPAKCLLPFPIAGRVHQ
jgi:hypothetical protein